MEPGTLQFNLYEKFHQWLLQESPMYKYAYENNLPGLMNSLQNKYYQEFLENIQ